MEDDLVGARDDLLSRRRRARILTSEVLIDVLIPPATKARIPREFDHQLTVRAAPVECLEQPIKLRRCSLQMVDVLVNGD